MKLQSGNTDRGGVLVVTIVITALVGLMLTAYLSMVSSQHNFTQRSQVWNNAIPMCEAGIEEAMAHINHINTTSNFAINGWVFQGNRYRKERHLNRGECRMEIDNSMPPIITVQGRLKEPVGDGNVTRSVQVQTKVNFRFPNAILARGTVSLSGNGRIDSFNSTNTLQSGPGGIYDPAEATDRATVATVGRTANVISVGNMQIYGSVGTGPGGTVTLSPNGDVGSTAYNATHNGLIEPGHNANDVNVYIPPPFIPTDFGQPLTAGPFAGAVGTTNYTYVVGNGDYRINTGVSLSGNGQRMIITGKARILVNGATSVSGQAFIYIAPGASVEWYANGPVTIAGGGCNNATGLAKNFSLIGLSGALIDCGGNSRFIGTIYAPSASVTLRGTSDASGAVVANNFTLTGGMGLHYDEALRGDQREGRFLASSWKEIQL